MNFNYGNPTLEGVQPQQQQLTEESMTLNMASNNGVTNDDPGVIEVMASPESDGAFTEEMINQIISMLQNEGQITAETHTVIVHTPGGTMLRVQIQQVDGADLEQANTQELSNSDANASVPNAMVTEQQDQLVYLGQSADELQENTMQQQFLNNNQMLQNGSAISNPQQQQYLTMEQPTMNVTSNNMMGSFSSSNAITTNDTSIPASLMSDVAEQVLQAANIIDSGFRSTATNDVMLHQPVMNGVNLHTTSLNNGVVLSYEQPKLGTETVYQNQQPISISNNISQQHSRPSSVNKIKQNRKYNNQQSDHGASQRSRQNNKSSIISKRKPVNVTHTVTSEIVRIKIDTGYSLTNRNPICLDDDVIRIQTNTGHVKPRTPKFFRCTTCSIHFVTEQSLLQHINHGCMGNKKKTSYECTYCLAKFPSKSKTMDHLKLCSKRSQMKTKRNQHLNSMQSKSNRNKSSNSSKAVEVEIDSDGDEINVQHQEKTIIYDDDEDMDIDLGGDHEDYDTTVGKVSQKHLGPILKGGKFQCRDCDRTFAKDSQYKRHEGVCTNAPLNTSRIDITSVPEKKRGRPPKKVSVGDGTKTPVKPKLSSVGEPNKKKATINHEEPSEIYDMAPSRKSYKKKDPEDIMEMLDTNLNSNLIDGGRSLSESFLQCLDENESEKLPTPVKAKPTVCGLCICHMESADALIDHIKSTHGKDIVNMHAILTNNTDLRTFKCSLCPLHFISTEAVNNHLVAHHNEKMQDRLKSLQANSLDIPCPLCAEKLMTTDLFQQHLAIEHTKHFPQTALLPAMKPEELDAKSSKAAQLTSQANASDPWLTGRLCMQCGEACSNEEQLQLHSKDCNQLKLEKHHCYIKGCNPQGYGSLGDLVAHVEQEHCHSSDGERKVFPNYQFFSTWLLQEIQRSGNKYSMVCSSVRAGCTYSTYLCPQYSTLKDQLPIHRCFSRIHVRTRWCSSKFDYSGRTEVVYFKTHKHEAVTEQTVDKVLKSSKRLKSLYVSVEKLPSEEASEFSKEASPDPEITIKKTLTRDATTPIITNGKEVAKPARKPDVKKLSEVANRVKETITSVISDVPNKKKRMREEENESSESEVKGAPIKKPRLNNNINSEVKKQPGKRGRPPASNGPPKKPKAPEAEENETTYVLPANISEWGKLFEMVKSQMDAGTLSNNRAGSTEAKGLLKNQSKITSMALEEQVRIFNRLCILANIQVD